jgi:hypothetical protein
MRKTYPILVLMMLLLALTGGLSHAAPGDEIVPGEIRADATYAVTVTVPTGTAQCLSNTVTISADATGTITRTAVVIANGQTVYLPVILKGAAQ